MIKMNPLPDEFSITIASLPDRKYLVAEIYYSGAMWVEISHERDTFEIQFYTPQGYDHLELNFDAAIYVLFEAKSRLERHYEDEGRHDSSENNKIESRFTRFFSFFNSF
jgi:hypothetical protein